MGGPTSRNFKASKGLGDAGETRVARFLAINAARIEPLIGQKVQRILVKMDTRYTFATTRDVINGVEIVYEPRHKAEQVQGDAILYGSKGAARHLEIKSEQYAFKRSAQDEGTPNIAFETHDIIAPTAYERLWAREKRDRHKPGYLAHPAITIPFVEPQAPEWFKEPGGHLKSRADWFIHFYSRSGHGVLLSLPRIKRSLFGGEYDHLRWFGACTLADKGSAAYCRQPGGQGISYYTVGKLLPVAELEQGGRALVFEAG